MTYYQKILFSLLFGCLSIFILGSFSFVLADTSSTNVNVDATVSDAAVCGNGVIEGAETCDDGGSNGACPASCSASCTQNSCSTGSPDTSAPSISGVVVTAGASTSSVVWNATDNVSVSGCTFEYGLTTSYGSSGSVGGNYNVALSGLTAVTQYFYRINCTDTSNNIGLYSSTFTTTVAADTSGPTISAVVTSTSQTSASINWSASDISSVSNCSLMYGTTPSFGSSAVVSGAYQTTVLSLNPNTFYHCQIACIDSVNNLSTVSCNYTTLSDATPPPDASGFSASGVNVANNLSWTYSEAVSDFAYYNIEWSLAGCPARGTGTFFQQITNVAQLSTQHTNLTNGTEYFYRLSVYDTSNNASAGVCVQATPTPLAGTCGNGIVESGETCDDGNSNNNDACLNTCTIATCGDGVIRSGVEECDSPQFNGQSCTTRGYDSGSLGCVACTFDESNCVNAPVTCGNGIVESGETCDDGNSNQNDSCTNACQAAVCGDGVIRSGVEECDSPQFGGASCTSLGYSGGSLLCGATCSFDTSSCTGVRIIDAIGEICDNNIDDDSDGTMDCSDSDCITSPVCFTVPACADGIDNDGDGLIDLSDPGCVSASDMDEYNLLEVTVPENAKISSLLYWIAERSIAVDLENNTVKSLTGDQLTVGVLESSLYQVTPSTTLTLVLNGNKYSLQKESDGVYRADVLFPSVGVHEAAIEIFYDEGLYDTVSFLVESAPFGIISDNQDNILSDASVSLLDQNGNLVNLSEYRQNNPFITGSSGVYGFVVKNGNYILLVEKVGYAQRKVFSFRVTDNIINRSLTLLAIPETPQEVIGFVIQNISQITGDVFVKVGDVANNPAVEEATKEVVAPTLVGISTASVVPSLFSIIFPLLRFLFLQPILFVGKKRRQAWGVVYNSLNKLPIDLATIRLIDKKTGKVVQSRVTDSKGRYLFMVEPGDYLIEVFKQGFVFPSNLLAQTTEDGSFVDIYHGEPIVAQEQDAHITPNIPVDPSGTQEKSIRRIVAEKWLRKLQLGVAIVGVVGAIVSVLVVPSVLTISFLAVHCILYGLFHRYIKPKKPKGWGLVYEDQTQQPVGRAVARLFSKQFDKLVATQVTDNKGRYSFLVGPNDYYITVEKTGYAPEKSPPVAIKDETGLIAQDVTLKKDGQDKTT